MSLHTCTRVATVEYICIKQSGVITNFTEERSEVYSSSRGFQADVSRSKQGQGVCTFPPRTKSYKLSLSVKQSLAVKSWALNEV